MCQTKLKLFVSGQIHCPLSELNLKFTLNGGQSFRWKETSKGQWTGVFSGRVWTISQENDTIFYKVFKNSSANLPVEKSCKNKNFKTNMSSDISEKLLINYFRLDTCLKELYKNWSNADSNFGEVSEMFYGIRIMKQDPVENIFSFICSSNNFISRISSMVEKLCSFYGENICEVDGQTYHSFPSVDALAKPGVDEKLRESGFGYRAKYIHQSAVKIVNLGGDTWLEKLKEMNYTDAKVELMKLTGIGAKVADCICLMSLGHLEAVPVDTHVFQIASQYYLPHLKSVKSVTPKIYDEIGNHFRTLYGPLAGWAHTILFCADLKKFQNPPAEKRKTTSKRNDMKKKKKKN